MRDSAKDCDSMADQKKQPEQPTTPTIGIVILQYRTWEMTRRCVESIDAHPPCETYRIFLVDNHSPNRPPFDLRQFIKEHHIRFLRNKTNLGYNGGNNVGLRAALEAGCRAVLLTNNDIVFRPGCIGKLYTGLGLGAVTTESLDVLGQPMQKIGVTCPKLYDESGRIHRFHMMRQLTLSDKYLVTTALNRLFAKRFQTYYGWDRDYNTSFPIFAAQGSCVMLSAECARAVTPFDETPFLYEEEQMLGIRVKSAGFCEQYIPEAEAEHRHGGSTRQVKAFSFAHNVRSEMYFCRRYLHAKQWQILPLFLYRFVQYAARCTYGRDFRRQLFASLRIMREGFRI